MKPAEYNPRKRLRPGDEEYESLKRSIETFGYVDPIIVNGDGTVIGGHQRLFVLTDLGYSEADVAVVNLSKSDEKALNIALNKISGEWDESKLAEIFSELNVAGYDATVTGYDSDEVSNILGFMAQEIAGEAKEENSKSISERFIFPPTSVLNARCGEWVDRKSAWIEVGIDSEVGRDKGLTFKSAAIADPGFYEQKARKEKELGRILSTSEFEENYYEPPQKDNATSIFDPVLCELCYKWFSAENARIIDPFSGGSVRGIVAALTGRCYTGIDIRPEQIAANESQWAKIQSEYTNAHPPRWVTGDSGIVLPALTEKYDMIFSCPPYADLEVYSDLEQDLSNMDYPAFLEAYRAIIRAAVDRLKEDRFAAFVVGEVRDKKGNYRNFVADTIAAFRDAGMEYYNEIIIVTPISGLRFRMGKTFAASRKVGKTHQNVLVFVKGNAKKAAEYCGDISVDMPGEYLDDSELPI